MNRLARKLNQLGFDALFLKDFENATYQNSGVPVFAGAAVERNNLHLSHRESIL
jgi:hypothetical protein